MARVQLLIDDPVNRLTVKAILEADGHEMADCDPQVLIADAPERAEACPGACPRLVLAAASEIGRAVAAMRRGVYGYIFVPLQPGEVELMVRRALASRPEPAEEAIESLEALEQRHIASVLRRCRGNRAEAARLLGIGRNTLWRKLKQGKPRTAEGE